MGKPPAQPSAEEQFAIQKRLQEQAETEATEKAETARRKAMLEEQRKQARRRSGSSLVSRRDTGLLGTVDIESAGTGGNYESLYESDS